MSPTPNPTPEAVFEALPLVDGRVGVGVAELMRRLRAGLPPLFDYANAECGLHLTPPSEVRLRPANLSDASLNALLIEVQLQTQGAAPGLFRNEVVVKIHALEERLETAEQVLDAFDRVGVIRGFLYTFLTGCVDEQGRAAWRLLEPQGVAPLPEEMDGYDGLTCTYRMVQAAEDDNWT